MAVFCITFLFRLCAFECCIVRVQICYSACCKVMKLMLERGGVVIPFGSVVFAIVVEESLVWW